MNALRLSIFILLICTLLIAEWRWPFRRYPASKFKRLIDNLGLMAISSIVQRILSTGGVYAVAVWAKQNSLGVLNLAQLPDWTEIILTLLVLDFAIYLQHRIFHKFDFLWRIHRVHHSDIGFDCTTAVRFHFIEISLSMLYKMLLVILTGAPAIAVLIFEVLLNGFALFNHSNIHFKPSLDHWLRHFVITPDMHRIHHSSQWRETNSNYGFSIPYWDKLCGTYLPDAKLGQCNMHIGAPDQPDKKSLNLMQLLMLPFRPI